MERRERDKRGARKGWVLDIAWTVVLAVGAGLSGCGGGGTGPEAGGSSSGGSGSPGTGSIRVKVTDALGEVVAGAEVWVSAANTGARTDMDGVVRFDNVPAGTSSVCAHHTVRGDSCSAPDPVSVEKGKVLDLSLQLGSLSMYAAAVLSATVDPGGVSADGKSLDVMLRVAVTGPTGQGSWFVDGPEWGYNRIQVSDCAARTGDELLQLGPRCIRGADGRDASYSFAQVNDLGFMKTVERPGSPWAVGLLIDQSDAGFSGDWLPNDPRLFAAKFFADRLPPATPLLVGAFSSDGWYGTGSRLPQRPVTFFPVEAPAFLTSRAEAFDVLRDLQLLVGGGAPFYEAIAEGVEYMAARTPPDRSRALVILADGKDTTCGTGARCAAARRDIIDRARDAAVQLFIVGDATLECPPEGSCPIGGGPYVNWESDAQLLAREGGFPIATGTWSSSVPQMELAGQWLQPSMNVQDISLRLTSDTAGAFAPGATVMGRFTGANPSQCPMGCEVHYLSFTVEVP